jgi:hypothetical protein
VLVTGPFTTAIHDARRWAEWVDELGGPTVRLVWVRTDADTLRRRLRARGSPRDTGKLADFDAFLARMRPDEPPPVPHLAIDNTEGAPDITAQLRPLIHPARGRPGARHAGP